MAEWLSRVERLIGDEALQRLFAARVAVIGLGGVGAAAAEALCRSGIGSLLLVDADVVDVSNLNRQLIATHETVGEAKTEAAARRLGSINPDIELTLSREFLGDGNLDFLADWRPDVVLDAIDTVTAKLALAKLCAHRKIMLISCFGTGNRLHPELLRLGTAADTAGCGCRLAQVMRKELKKRAIPSPLVVYSLEKPLEPQNSPSENGRHPPASMAFVPNAAGFTMAAAAVRGILAQPRQTPQSAKGCEGRSLHI